MKANARSSPPDPPAAPRARLPVVLCWLWASPATLLGLTAGCLSLASGGQVFRHRHTLEFCGGFSAWYLRRIARARAMTLGHVILGVTVDELDSTRTHEWVHVRQYERWGPAFIPVYLLASGWQWLRGGNCYLDNPFEIEAFADDERRRRDGDFDIA